MVVMRRILVWDIPTRVFHWLYALAFIVSYLNAFSERLRNYHVALGYILLGLLVFRLVWGFFGTRYAKFNSFVFSPQETFCYFVALCKRNPAHYLGHNPAGSIAVWLLLVSGIFVGVTGVLSLQDEASDLVMDMHADATNIMLGIVALHVVGVLVSSITQRENLPRAMLTGTKLANPNEGIQRGYGWLGVLMVGVLVVFWFVYVKRPLG